ncbi:MAG: sigma-70 family RNA polymerase sigma factor [Deltaproteobacteria bacterium]|nr:sigma-70 family RNA polymerase sigma factor [Deltaproteobacteria bacterium]
MLKQSSTRGQTGAGAAVAFGPFKRTTYGTGRTNNWPLPYRAAIARDGDDAGLATADAPEKRERHEPASDAINVYFRRLKKLKLLTAEEERALAGRVAKKDAAARQRMIESNLRLAVNIAKRYINRGLPLQDLIEEGNIGLIKAVERFKVTKECKFSTYATYWIKQSIERAITNQAGVVRLPIHIANDLAKLTRASTALVRDLQREPSVVELAEKTGLSGRYVKRLHTVGKKSCSLETSFNEDTEQTLLDKLEDERAPQPMEMIDTARRVEKIQEMLACLDENERRIVRLRFGFGTFKPHTLESIGKAFGVTRERVRQLESKALVKLRNICAQSNITSFDAI